MSVSVEFALGQFAQDFCWENPQQYGDALVALLTGRISGSFSGVIISNSPPAVQDQDKLWVKVDSNGRPVAIYIYKGQWMWPHPKAPSGSERMIWVGSEADLWAYDGGDGNDPSTTPPTITSGAMWEKDDNFDFRIPMGAGTNATTYDGNPGTTLAVAANAGAERVALAANELPEHKHLEAMRVGTVATGSSLEQTWDDLEGSTAVASGDRCADVTEGAHSNLVHPYTDNQATTQLSHQNLPPVRGVFYAKRTARTYLTAT